MTGGTNAPAETPGAREKRGCLTLACGLGGDEWFISADPKPGAAFEEVCGELAACLGELGAAVVSMEVFGFPADGAGCLDARFGAVTWPVTWVSEGFDMSRPLRGVQVWAVAGCAVEPVKVDGRTVGSVFSRNGARWCRLGGLVPPDITLPREEQTRAMFWIMERSLQAAGMSFRDVARTWFYNEAMLDWYDGFNAVRTAFFREGGVFERLVPASTGIGGRNAAGSALTAGVLAVRSAAVQIVPSPLQCPAPDYGSSFSRAVEIGTEAGRLLCVSGTASISPDGCSAHLDDMERQVGLTLDVVAAILESRGMDWERVCRGIAYFKRLEDAPVLGRVLAARGIKPLPLIYANTDICRDELLFEIELDAAVEG